MEMNFDHEREVLQRTKAELLARVAVIDSALAALGAQTNGTRRVLKVDGVAADGQAVRMARRPMSAKAKKAARDRMLAYWAGKRAEAKASAKGKAARAAAR
jgi:hypothetical protein